MGIGGVLQAGDVTEGVEDSFDLSFLDDKGDKGEKIVNKEVKDDITQLDLDSEGDEEEEDEGTEEGSEEGTEGKKDDKEKELNLEDGKDEFNLEIPNRQKIIKAFPDLFKKFPSIEKAIYREQQYSEVFSTIKEAESAKESVGVLNSIDRELTEGNIERILTTVKRGNEGSFNKLVNNFLSTIGKVDQGAQLAISTQVIKTILGNVDKASGGKRDDSEAGQLGLAAAILNKYLFQTDKIDSPDELAKTTKVEIDPKEQALNDRERKFNQDRLDSAVSGVSDSINTLFERRVRETIDPNDQMTAYVKNNAVKDVIKEYHNQRSDDKRFTSLLDRLWTESQKNDFNKHSLDKIREAIKNHAKSTLPDIIRRVKADALKGTSVVKKNQKDDNSERPLPRRNPAISGGKNSSGGTKDLATRMKDKSLTTADLLMLGED